VFEEMRKLIIYLEEMWLLEAAWIDGRHKTVKKEGTSKVQVPLRVWKVAENECGKEQNFS
jgi:hypothetical protein